MPVEAVRFVAMQPFAEPPTDAQPTKRRKWIPYLGAVAGALVLAVGLFVHQTIKQSGSKAAAPITVIGTIDVTGCYKPGFEDVHPGAQVVVSDSTEKTVAIGDLEGGGEACQYRFTVTNVPAGLGFYGVEVSHRGRLQYSEDQIREPVRLSLGG